MIRKVEKEEIVELYPYIHEIFSDMEIPALEELGENRVKNLVIDAMQHPYYRYGYKNAWVCERKKQIAGVFFGYPNEWEKLIDGPLQAVMLKNDLPIDTIAQENESLAGEWYLDTLVTNPDFRRQGVAQEMLDAVNEIAENKGYDKISLNCDIDNLPAYNLYKKMGYTKKTQIVLSHHIYWHMVKEI